MSIYVLNKSNNVFLNIEGAQLLCVQGRKLSNGSKGFAVLCYHEAPKLGSPTYVIAEFSDKADALECWNKVTKHEIDNIQNSVLEVESKVKASIIEIPSEKDKNSVLMK